MRIHRSGWINVTVFHWMYADFRFPLEPAGREERKSGGEQKSADVEQKTVMLIYSYPKYAPWQFSQAFDAYQKKCTIFAPPWGPTSLSLMEMINKLDHLFQSSLLRIV